MWKEVNVADDGVVDGLETQKIVLGYTHDKSYKT